MVLGCVFSPSYSRVKVSGGAAPLAYCAIGCILPMMSEAKSQPIAWYTRDAVPPLVKVPWNTYKSLLKFNKFASRNEVKVIYA